ncbi:hypothetical protein NEOLEDRAFT_1141997 [Neolentinus lepideus HHB14362 ss-1]|uniref:Uncharacterized protein n=1 Tax=Neolentinus lepideus HHB14362 ss-1 TaxID=1314782 RepID=A0A165NEK4_9AGAM|nr:hypothetical protein NEOLEDRAFT_1141997 [Neolentinus lepideus HHB14362 ss-1]
MATFATRDSLLVADDIVDCILRSLLDFSCLLSVIVVSKRVYNSYHCHSASIRRSIAFGLVGPALPQALRLVRYDDLLSRDPSEWPSESQVFEASITLQEANSLARNVRVVDQLESLFSRSFYTSSSRSLLSEQELHHFHRALYRFWLYANMFCTGLDTDVDNDVASKRAFFTQLSENTELFQFAQVVEFLNEMIRWICTANGRPFSGEAANGDPYEMGFAISLGPGLIVDIFTGFPDLPEPREDVIVDGPHFVRGPYFRPSNLEVFQS